MAKHPFEKLFTADEANDLIPRLEVLVRELQSTASELSGRITALAEADERIDSLTLQEIVELHPDLAEPAKRLGQLAAQIESLGCFLKDIDQGLVDFPGEIDDEVVFLCWQYGETRVIAWHPIEAGFAQRKSIPGASGPYLN